MTFAVVQMVSYEKYELVLLVSTSRSSYSNFEHRGHFLAPSSALAASRVRSE